MTDTNDITKLAERLQADNDWLMRSRFPGHELRALEAGNNLLRAADALSRIAAERDEARAQYNRLGDKSLDIAGRMTAAERERDELRAELAALKNPSPKLG